MRHEVSVLAYKSFTTRCCRRVLIAVGIARPNYQVTSAFAMNVYLCLVVCDYGARLYEASTWTLVVLDVDR